MKIAFVIDDTLDKPDGVQQYVLGLGRQYAMDGHEVHYLAGSSSRQDLDNLHSLGRTVKVRFNGNYLATPLPASRTLIQQLLEREQYDVLHVQMPFSPLLAGRVVQAAPEKTVVVGTFHILPYSFMVDVATCLLGLLAKATVKRFDKIYAVSPDAAVFAKRALRVPEVALAPNATDVRHFAEAKEFARYADDVPTIMFLGRLVPRKGCATLLQAAAKLKYSGDVRFKLVICGKGPMLSELKAMARQLRLHDDVEFAGFISEDDKPRYIASADIMVFPSRGGESFGIVLLEAMASGRPLVLAGDNPGYRSVMSPREQLLFDPADATILARKLAQFLSDKAARRQAVEWQRKYVQRFDMSVVANGLLADYKRLLKNKAQ